MVVSEANGSIMFHALLTEKLSMLSVTWKTFVEEG